MRIRSAVLCVLLGGALTCAAQEASLGDVARQQKAVSRPAAKRVIDNDTLPHASAAEARNGAVVMPKGADSKDGAKAEAKPIQGQAAVAPATPADAQRRLDELKATAEAQQRAINKFEEELKDESVSAERRQVFEAGLSTAKQALEQVTKEIAGVEHSVKPAEQGQPEDAKPQAEDPKAKPDEAAAPPPNNTGDKSSDSKAPEKSADNKDGN